MGAVEFIKLTFYISTMCQAPKSLRRMNFQPTTEVFQSGGLFRVSGDRAIFKQFKNKQIYQTPTAYRKQRK